MEPELDLDQALQATTEKVNGWVQGFIQMIPNFVAAVVVLVLFWGLAKLVRKMVERVLRSISTYESVNRLVSAIAYLVVIAVGLFVALSILNLEKTVTSLLAGAGIIGLAIGFAAQDTVENLFAGVMLSIRRPIREGDLVETNDTFGIVNEINLRATRIRTPQGQMVYIPSSEVYKNPLTNYSEYGQRRVDLSCGVAYGDDLERAKQVAVDALEDLEMRDESRDVELYFGEFGGSSVNFTIRFWIDFSASQGQFLAAQSEAVVRLKQAFDENGITIPFPIRTLDFGVVGGRPLAEELDELPSTGDGDSASQQP